MFAYVISALVGVLCIALGISNMKGNISSLHSYHRKRVSEEDRPAFGKLVGLGTILIGIAVIVFSLLSAVALLTENTVYITVGAVVMAVGMLAGLGISFYAMIKYNKGIF